jgi:hypothetical protein
LQNFIEKFRNSPLEPGFKQPEPVSISPPISPQGVNSCDV